MQSVLVYRIANFKFRYIGISDVRYIVPDEVLRPSPGIAVLFGTTIFSNTEIVLRSILLI